MRITTLGTSHGDHTYCRFNSATLIEIGDRLYLIDAGEPVTALLIRAGQPIERLRAVFITHMHADHAGGLSNLIADMIKRTPEQGHTRLLLPDPAAVGPLEAWLEAQYVPWPSRRAAIETIAEGLTYQDDLATVTAIPTRHVESADGPVCFAYQFEAEGKRLLFTGDLQADFSDFPSVARSQPFDLCVCEMTHFEPAATLPILCGCPIGRLVFSHIHNPWHGRGEETLKRIFTELPYPFHVAHDGDVFEL